MAPPSKRIASKTTGSPSTRRRHSRHSLETAKTLLAQKKKKAAVKHKRPPKSPGIVVVDEEEDAYWEVDTVVARRKKKGIVEFLIRWKGCSAEDDTWEPESNLCDSALVEAQAFEAADIHKQQQRRRKKAHLMRNTQYDTIKEGATMAPSKSREAILESSDEDDTTSTVVVEKPNPIARRRELRGDPIDPDPNDSFDYNPGVFRDEQVSDEYMSNEEPSEPSEEIPPSISNLFSGAIKSVHAQLAVELITQLLVSHNYIPDDNLMRTMYETVIYGPKSDGTLYPDPRKVELVANYLSGACSNPDMRNTLIDMGTSRWLVIEETLHQVEADIYQCPGDYCSSSNAALSRISSSLQVAASGLNLLLNLIKYQLKPAMKDPDKIRQLRDQPIVRAFLECQGGIRGALKFIVRMNATAWTRNGHFLVGDLKKLYAHDPAPEPANVQCCSKQARNVIQTLAKITSYTAWIYSVVEKESMEEKKFASIIVDVLNSELSINKVDIDPFEQSGKKMSTATMHKYWEKVKLRFALDLNLVQEEFSGPFHVTVADVLGLRKKYDYLFD